MHSQIRTLLITFVCFLSTVGNSLVDSMSDTQRHILAIVSVIASVLLMINAICSLAKTMKEKKN